MPEYVQWTLVGLGVLLFVWLASGGRSSNGDDEAGTSRRRRQRRSRSLAWRPRGGLPAAIRARVRAGRATVRSRTRGQRRGHIAGRRNTGSGAPPIDLSQLPRPPVVNISWSSGGAIEVPFRVLSDTMTVVPTPVPNGEGAGPDPMSREARHG